MRPVTACFLTALIFSIFSVPALAQNIRGDWELKSCKVSGQDIPTDQLSAMKLTFSYSTFNAVDGDRKSSGKIKNDNRENPKRLTFTIDQGDDSGRELKAIYKRTGKELKIVFSRGGEFPTELDSNESNQYVMMMYSTAMKKDNATDRGSRQSAFETGPFEAGPTRSSSGG